jgi:uncharacterized SAM-binding protein YcdF (DUF218 family)
MPWRQWAGLATHGVVESPIHARRALALAAIELVQRGRRMTLEDVG